MLKIKLSKTISDYQTESLTQWDSNQILEISGVKYTTTPALHFANLKSKKALVVMPTVSDGVLTVEIPNSLLRQPYPIYAYIYSYDNNAGITDITITIPVAERVQPDDYIFSADKSVSTLAELNSKVDELIATKSAELDEVATQFLSDVNANVMHDNILINGDFREKIINQRGKTTYGSESAGVYTVDRWIKYNANTEVTVGDGYLKVKCISESIESGLNQPIEFFKKLLGTKVTLTIKVKDVVGDWNIGLATSDYPAGNTNLVPDSTSKITVTASGSHQMTVTLPESVTGTYLNVALYSSDPTAGDYIDIEYIKLEEGSISTAIPAYNINAELTKCKRYCQVIDLSNILMRSNSDGTTLRYVYPLAVNLRATPSEISPSSITGKARFDGTVTSDETFSNFVIKKFNTNLMIDINVSTAVASYAVGFIDNLSESKIIMDAEIY